MGILDFFRGSESARIARRFMAGMRELGETRRMEFNEAASLIVVLDEEGNHAASWYLGNLRHELKEAPKDEHEAIYQRYLRPLRVLGADTQATYEQARPRLRLLLKDSSYPAFIELLHRVEHGAKDDNPLVWRPVAADIIALCVEQSEATLRFITATDLKGWGVSAQQALDDAHDNVRALPAEYCKSQFANFVFHDDSFQAARLVCEAPLRAYPLKGLPVAVVPDRDTLFFVGSEDEQGLLMLARLNAQQFEKANRLISGRPLVLTESGWQEFVPPESSRLEFANIIRRYDTSAWNEYRNVLEKDLAAKGEDIFVAGLELYEEKESGALFTSITWSRDVDSVLPPADRIHFYDRLDDSIRFAPWSEVLRVCGAAFQQMDGRPLRYRVTVGFPTPEQFLQMGAQRL